LQMRPSDEAARRNYIEALSQATPRVGRVVALFSWRAAHARYAGLLVFPVVFGAILAALTDGLVRFLFAACAWISAILFFLSWNVTPLAHCALSFHPRLRLVASNHERRYGRLIGILLLSAVGVWIATHFRDEKSRVFGRIAAFLLAFATLPAGAAARTPEGPMLRPTVLLLRVTLVGVFFVAIAAVTGIVQVSLCGFPILLLVIPLALVRCLETMKS
jgi:hypothetical protein